MKFLLLQARNPGDVAAAHEVLAFAEALGISSEGVRPWDLLRGAPSPQVLEEVDCVLVGGSGEFGVSDAEREPWLKEFIDFMGSLAEQRFPTFASCFGFQALVLAGGGEVATDKARAEVGTFELSVTAEGAQDPLFQALAPSFLAQLGHKDHVLRLPAGVLHLVSSERSPYQALKIEGAPIYATQFHPELSMTQNRERYLSYLEAYSQPEMPDPLEKVLAAFQDSQGATDLLPRFVREVLPSALK